MFVRPGNPRSQTGSSRRPRAGFSLVELMGVAIVLGLIATLTFVSWEAVLPRTTLNSAVRELAAILSETRSDAISRSASFQIEYNFEPVNGNPVGYRVITPFRKTAEGGLAAFNEERFTLPWHILPDSVSFQKIVLSGEPYTNGTVIVGFSALGAASDHTVVLKQSPYGHLYTIEVLALTGQIRFHDGEFLREAPREDEFK